MIIHVSLKNDHQNVLQSGNQNDFLNIKLLSSFTVISFFIQKKQKTHPHIFLCINMWDICVAATCCNWMLLLLLCSGPKVSVSVLPFHLTSSLFTSF